MSTNSETKGGIDLSSADERRSEPPWESLDYSEKNSKLTENTTMIRKGLRLTSDGIKIDSRKHLVIGVLKGRHQEEEA